MAYNCYIAGIPMPETPEKLTMKIKGKNKTVDILNGGELSLLRSPGLTEINLPLTFPMLTGGRSPDYYLGMLEKLKIDKSPTQFIMTRTSPDGKLLFDTNLKVSVEDYTVTESAKDGLDLTVDVNLKEYRDYRTRIITVSENGAHVTNSRPEDTAPSTVSHTVKKGDTLWGIAKMYLGDGARYSEIFSLNTDKISNPNLIYPGQVLVIPS